MFVLQSNDLIWFIATFCDLAITFVTDNAGLSKANVSKGEIITVLVWFAEEFWFLVYSAQIWNPTGIKITRFEHKNCQGWQKRTKKLRLSVLAIVATVIETFVRQKEAVGPLTRWKPISPTTSSKFAFRKLLQVLKRI